jgi:hypothetical protein
MASRTPSTVSGRTHVIQLRRRELDEKFPGLIDALVTEGPS